MQHYLINGVNIAVYTPKNFYIIAENTENIPIVFLHGFTGTAMHHWRYELENYQNILHCQTLAFDFRGHGQSEFLNDYSKNNQSIIDLIILDLLHLLKKFKWTNINIIASSFGSFIACKVYINYPNLINKMVLISATGRSSEGLKNALSEIYSSYTSFFEALKFQITLEEVALSSRQKKFLQTMLSLHNERTPPYNKLLFQKTLVEQFLLAAQNGWSILPDLKEAVNVPTLVIHGDQDYIEVEEAVSLFRSIPKSNLIVIPNAGHLPHLKYPALIERFIINFLLIEK